MSVPPRTPDDWITVKLQGRKCDIGPDTTVEDLFTEVRYMIGSKSLKVPGGTASRHRYTAERYGIVKKADVGTKDDGDWEMPDTKDDLVPYDLEGVQEGDELRLFQDPDWPQPVYPEAGDGEVSDE